VISDRCRRVVLSATVILGMDVAVAQNPDGSQLIESLVRYLGVDPDQRQAVLDGATVVAGLPAIESREEEIAAGGAFMLIAGVSARDLVETFLATGSFQQMHEVSHVDPVALDPAGHSLQDQFSAFELELDDHPRNVVRAPAEYLNLAPEELAYFDSLDPEALDIADSLTMAMRRVLSERLLLYAADGLDADRVYIRAGDSVLPTEQLKSALSGMSALEGPFEPFVAEIMSPIAARGDATGTHQLHWLEKIADGRRVVALADQIVYFDRSSALAAEIHYYVSGTYDALLTVVGATPVEDQTLMFAISHTFTDRVAGVGSGLRHRVARRIVSEGLAAHLERVRERVAGNR
jgi:hypothetical protein